MYNKAQLNSLLIKSARYGLVDLVKECLVLGADPKTNNSRALRWAAYNGHTECVKLLIPVSDPEDVEHIKENYPKYRDVV